MTVSVIQSDYSRGVNDPHVLHAITRSLHQPPSRVVEPKYCQVGGLFALLSSATVSALQYPFPPAGTEVHTHPGLDLKHSNSTTDQ